MPVRDGIPSHSSRPVGSREAGFTLVEALVAIVILVFGLMAVTNLLIVAASSNAAGNHSSAATTQATEVLERLKSIPFLTLPAGGNLDADVGLACPSTPCVEGPAPGCVIPGCFNSRTFMPGVGVIHTTWVVTTTSADVRYIVVRSESVSPLIAARSRSEFATFRSCTSPGCPP